MQIIINQSAQLEGNAEQLLQEKLNKLTTFYERIESANVHIRQDDGQGTHAGTIVVKLAVPGPDLVAEASEATIEQSIAEVTEKLRRQLRKLKEKQSNH